MLESRRLQILSECAELRKKHPKLKRKKLDKIVDLEKRLYYYKVWVITESQPLHKLRNFKKRGWKSYHLDHICSIAESYRNGISPEIVGNIKNLRFIPAKQNLKKGYKVTKTILQETLKRQRKFKG